MKQAQPRTADFDWFMRLRVAGRKNSVSQSYQTPSVVDDKIVLALALYGEGLGTKAISKKLFGHVSAGPMLARRFRDAGVLDQKRKSPAWLGKTHNSLTDAQKVGRLLAYGFEFDQREWKRGIRRYEQSVIPKDWKVEHKRMMADPERRIKFYLRKRLRHCVIDKQHSLKSTELFGCTMPELREHLESKFLPWMSWANYGSAWHIDHRKPCKAFDLTDPEQAKVCFHYTNLQPLEANENIRKSDMLPDGTRARHA